MDASYACLPRRDVIIVGKMTGNRDLVAEPVYTFEHGLPRLLWFTTKWREFRETARWSVGGGNKRP